MQSYKFKVIYQPGPKNIANSLSWLVSREESGSKHSSQAEVYVRFVAISATPTAMTTREVEEASAEDEELSAIRNCINGESWDHLVYKQYIPCSGELCTIGQLILRGTRIVIPKELRPRILSLAHEGHLGIVGTKQKLRSKVWWPGMEKRCREILQGRVMGVNWSVVPVPQNLLQQQHSQADHGEIWQSIS